MDDTPFLVFFSSILASIWGSCSSRVHDIRFQCNGIVLAFITVRCEVTESWLEAILWGTWAR